jgi:hypothetical protein
VIRRGKTKKCMAMEASQKTTVKPQGSSGAVQGRPRQSMARSREDQGLSKDTLGQALRRAAEEWPRPKVSVGSVLEDHGQDKPVMAVAEPHMGD